LREARAVIGGFVRYGLEGSGAGTRLSLDTALVHHNAPSTFEEVESGVLIYENASASIAHVRTELDIHAVRMSTGTATISDTVFTAPSGGASMLKIYSDSRVLFERVLLETPPIHGVELDGEDGGPFPKVTARDLTIVNPQDRGMVVRKQSTLDIQRFRVTCNSGATGLFADHGDTLFAARGTVRGCQVAISVGPPFERTQSLHDVYLPDNGIAVAVRPVGQ
jgi:hypothetical protein